MNLRHPPVPKVLPSLHRVPEVSLPGVPGVLVCQGRRSASFCHYGVGLAQH